MEPTTGVMVWRYTKAIAAQLFYLAVIGFVFSSIGTPATRLIVAVLGIIYAAIRTVAVGQLLYFQPLWMHLFEAIDEIRSTINPDFPIDREGFAQAHRLRRRTTGLAYVDIFGLAAISLLCLWQAWTALNTYPAP